MDASAVAERYFEAWNRRDPGGDRGRFVEGGTYTDPNVPDGSARRRPLGTPAASSPGSPTSPSRSRARASAPTGRSPPSG